MVILVLLIVGLAIDLWHLLSGVWPLLVIALALCGLGRRLLAPLRRVRAAEVRDRLHHEQARREIDRIAAEAELAIYDAALRHGDVIEGTAVEVRDR